MTKLKSVCQLDVGRLAADAKDVNFREVWNDPQSIGIELKIRAGAVLARHSALQPIRVQCLSGSGRFLAGEGLDAESALTHGTVIALDAEIPHEVTAFSELHLLVTKFK